MKDKLRVFCLLVFLIVFLSISPQAKAIQPVTELDLTSLDASGIINGALFYQASVSKASPGQFDPFVRIQHNNTEQGYNTSGRTDHGNKAPFDDKKDLGYTHDLQLSDISGYVDNIGGIDYYEFILNINQDKSKNKDGQLLSLDALQIYLSDAGSKTTETVSDLGKKIYDLDGPGTVNNYILLDYSLNDQGTATADMLALIPTSLFTLSINDQPVSDPFIYLYSKMGENNKSNDGFEDWGDAGVSGPPLNGIPEPASMALLSFGLLGLARITKKKNR